MNKTKHLVLCSLFAAILCISAFFTFPLPFAPAPITLQVLAVCVTALALERRTAISAMVLYLLLGLVGLPVYSGMGSGIGVLAGPTGGYLWGFLPALILMATLQKHAPTGKPHTTFLYMVCGLVVIYFFGTLQLSLLTGNSFLGSLGIAVLPYLPADFAKLVLAVPVTLALRRAQGLPVGICKTK